MDPSRVLDPVAPAMFGTSSSGSIQVSVPTARLTRTPLSPLVRPALADISNTVVVRRFLRDMSHMTNDPEPPDQRALAGVQIAAITDPAPVPWQPEPESEPDAEAWRQRLLLSTWPVGWVLRAGLSLPWLRGAIEALHRSIDNLLANAMQTLMCAGWHDYVQNSCPSFSRSAELGYGPVVGILLFGSICKGLRNIARIPAWCYNPPLKLKVAGAGVFLCAELASFVKLSCMSFTRSCLQKRLRLHPWAVMHIRSKNILDHCCRRCDALISVCSTACFVVLCPVFCSASCSAQSVFLCGGKAHVPSALGRDIFPASYNLSCHLP